MGWVRRTLNIFRARRLDAVVGWGNRPIARRAKAYADRNNLPFFRLEDGFLGVTPPHRPRRILSLVIDDVGI